MTERIVVVGADAAGMSAASQALRIAESHDREIEIVALERGDWTSYSACGIPYWVAGDVDGPDALVARTPEEHRERGIDLRMQTEATALDLDAGLVRVRDVRDGSAGDPVPFDQLVLATGASAARPPIPGIDAVNVHGVQTLGEGAALVEALTEQPERAVVIGAGYIGIEMAEALVRRGVDVVVVDQAPEPMTTLDPDLGSLVREAMTGIGMDVRVGVEVERIETVDDDAGSRAVAVHAGGDRIAADLVVTGLGVRPNTGLAEAAGLPLGDSGALRVDDRMAVVGHPTVWAAGDCVESYDRVTGRWAHIPLGTHANRQGRVLGANLVGGSARYPGVIGTAVSKVCGLEIGRTGVGERSAEDAGIAVRALATESTTRAGYYPGAEPITVKVVAEVGSGVLVGGQVVGGEGAAKRIDTLATAVWTRMTVAELAMVDLSYAPPFSPTLDPVTIAARRLADRL